MARARAIAWDKLVILAGGAAAYTSAMKTYVRLQSQHPGRLPAEFQADANIRLAPALATLFLKEHSRMGDTVLDPFAGFGTTLLVAEAMGRTAFGLEIDAGRVAYVRSKLGHPQRLIHGDARQLLTYDLPPIDFSLTSPPYMSRNDPEDPLTNYSTPGRGYEAYLLDLQDIYRQLAQRLKPGRHAVIEVSNLKTGGQITPLAWDVARAVSRELTFEGEVVVGWDRNDYGYDHSYCLVFVRSV